MIKVKGSNVCGGGVCGGVVPAGWASLDDVCGGKPTPIYAGDRIVGYSGCGLWGDEVVMHSGWGYDVYAQLFAAGWGKAQAYYLASCVV